MDQSAANIREFSDYKADPFHPDPRSTGLIKPLFQMISKVNH